MGFLDRIIGRNEYYDEYEDEYIDDQGGEMEEVHYPEVEEQQYHRNNRNTDKRKSNTDRVVSISQNFEDEVVIIEPDNIRDAQRVCRDVQAGKTVICNLERIDQGITQRVIDFILGGTFTLHGQVTSISTMIFVITPARTRVNTVQNERVQPSAERVEQAPDSQIKY